MLKIMCVSLSPLHSLLSEAMKLTSDIINVNDKISSSTGLK